MAQSPLKPADDPSPVGPWWGAAIAMVFFAVVIGLLVWAIQSYHRRHDRRRSQSADALGFSSIAGQGDAVEALRGKLAALRVRLGGNQLRSVHAGLFEGWRVTFVDAKERDSQHMSLGWVGDGQVEPCPRSLVLLERGEMDLPDLMLEPDNAVYRLARGERRPRRAPSHPFDRNNRLAVGDERAAMLISDEVREHLADNRELTVRARGSQVAVSTDRRHVPDRAWHAFLAEAMTIAEALRDASRSIEPRDDRDDGSARTPDDPAGREGEREPAWASWAEQGRRPGRLI